MISDICSKDFQEPDNKINNYQEYFLIKEKKIFKILIIKRSSDIIIKCKNYEIKINHNDLLILTKSVLNTTDDAYEFLINIFDDDKVYIKDKIKNKEIKLVLNIYILNKERQVEFILVYNENNNLFINEINNNYNELKNEILYLKEEISGLKKEIDKLKNINSNFEHIKIDNDNDNQSHKNDNIEENSDPNNIEFLDIVKDSFSHYDLDNSFTVFNSIDNKLILIYSNKKKSIISYDLINCKIIKEIHKAHQEYITNFRYHFDFINKRDLIISISGLDNNLKLWNANSLTCLCNFKNITNNSLYSACFLNDNNQLYIITSDCSYSHSSEPIQIFNLTGIKIKEIKNSNEDTFFIDNYYDNESNKNYILTGNNGYIKSYDYNENILYHKYIENGDSQEHYSIIIDNKEEMLKIIESGNDGHIRIWGFHSGLLLNKIKINDGGIYGICLWDNNNLFVGCKDKKIKLIDLTNGNITQNLPGHNNYVLTIKKINHPEYGECLISQGYQEDSIKLWINNEDIN